MDLVCFTDGACSANGKKNAKAGFAVVWPSAEEYNHSQRLLGDLQTNNRAEYSAVIHALEQANQIIDPSGEKNLHIYTDSMLLIKTVTEWMGSWKKNNWKKKTGDQIIANLDLVKTLDEYISKRPNVTFHHVKAHTKKMDWESIYNAKVDKMATDSIL
jgi:ribonuclease HI